MDILISSNLERLIFELSDRNFDVTAKRMTDLKTAGKYKLESKEKTLLDREFSADYVDEDECRETILEIFEEYGYLLDTHTSVAMTVAERFIEYSGTKNATVVLSTASPYKFTQDVLKAISGSAPSDAFKAAHILYEQTAAPIPEQLLSLKQKEIRFSDVIEKSKTVDAVMAFIEK